jgi:hypothetical protein
LIPGFGIWDPGLGSGIGKKSGSRSRIIFLRAEKPFFWFKYLNSLMRIWDPGSGMKKNSDPGSGIQNEKSFDPGSGKQDGKNSDPGSRIRDKHRGSAKLEISSPNLLGLKEPNNNQTLCGKGLLG